MCDDEALRDKFVHMYDRAMNHGDFGPVEQLCGDEFSCTNPLMGIDRIAGIKKSINLQRECFEGFHMEMENVFACPSSVTLVWRLTGRHRKEIYGQQPSNKPIEARGITVHQIIDGKSVGAWSFSEVIEKLRQANGSDASKAPESAAAG